MTANWQEIETAICSAYNEQAACYERALTVADRLEAVMPDADQTRQALEQIAQCMAQVAAIDGSLTPSRQQWRQAQRQPGPPLAAAMTRVTGLIERLQSAVAKLEQLACAHRDRLLPELDHVARGRQMQRAYGAARSSLR